MPQCPAIHPTKSGAVFCTKEKGHVEAGDPEHKGFRKRWVGQAHGAPPMAAIAMVALREMSQEEREREQKEKPEKLSREGRAVLAELVGRYAKKSQPKKARPKKAQPKKASKKEPPKPVKHLVVAQEWTEHERGWGIRPDGASLHRNEADRAAFCKDYWDREKKRNPSGMVPDEYSRESGDPKPVEVDAETYKKICESKNGIWMLESDYSKLGRQS